MEISNPQTIENRGVCCQRTNCMELADDEVGFRFDPTDNYGNDEFYINLCHECRKLLERHIAGVHALDKIRGTDEGSEGSGFGPEAVNEPES